MCMYARVLVLHTFVWVWVCARSESASQCVCSRVCAQARECVHICVCARASVCQNAIYYYTNTNPENKYVKKKKIKKKD